jgi:hypothetical protein
MPPKATTENPSFFIARESGYSHFFHIQFNCDQSPTALNSTAINPTVFPVPLPAHLTLPEPPPSCNRSSRRRRPGASPATPATPTRVRRVPIPLAPQGNALQWMIGLQATVSYSSLGIDTFGRYRRGQRASSRRSCCWLAADAPRSTVAVTCTSIDEAEEEK